ncbi:MAG TPA: MHYT domain-containing protein [Xanthobacteraceae bacterium]|nr:MHYT domain-containing protein [Xanthobacteraceae bacterium]
MPVTHEPWLVALSLIVAIQGAYVGLSLAVQVAGAVGLRRRLLLAGAAISLAVAIWSMHFVGMLAARLPLPVDYLVFPTLLSFLVCVLVVGAAVFAASAGPLTPLRLAGAACVMGTGIVTMHYIGMSALHASAHMDHAPLLVAAAMAIAIAASGLALWLAEGRGGRPPLLLSATALGIAISGMHYTAMAGVAFFPHASPSSTAPALSTDLLAIVVAIVAFVVSGIFLLALVPDRSTVAGEVASLVPPWPGSTTVSAAAAAATNSDSAASTGNVANPIRGSFAPLGGAGLPPRRLARQLPIERDGTTHFVAVDQVVAVHANAHYTYIFDGTSKLFCPLAIGDVESRLDTSRFLRVHRSHIVNIDRVIGLKRAGDSGLVELAGIDRYTVPVSRSRVGWLKNRLAPKEDRAVT